MFWFSLFLFLSSLTCDAKPNTCKDSGAAVKKVTCRLSKQKTCQTNTLLRAAIGKVSVSVVMTKCDLNLKHIDS